ncbi:MAG TPA: ABC transporter permease subunit [Thermomicrobiales bacterium]|jgi:Cu-processing system permease protein|nr:ABC transporter permease subunit [Thermomicrobiales bacterium]
MERSVITAIAARDIRSGVRNRWFMLYAVVFILLSVGFSMLAMGGSTLTGQPGFGRTAAGLLNLMLLMVPLIGLTIGAQSIVGERQDRSLDYLMAQPISTREIFVGKYLGAAASLALLLLLGFGVSGVVMAVRGAATGLGDFLLLVLLTTLLGLAMLSVGYLISSRSPQTAAALGIALTAWLVLVIVGDLGLMSSAIVMDLNPGTLLTLTLVNPLDVYKLLGVDLLQTSLDVLGPAGVYANAQLGGMLTPLLAALLLVWIVAPLPVGYLLFTRKDIR